MSPRIATQKKGARLNLHNTTLVDLRTKLINWGPSLSDVSAPSYVRKVYLATFYVDLILLFLTFKNRVCVLPFQLPSFLNHVFH